MNREPGRYSTRAMDQTSNPASTRIGKDYAMGRYQNNKLLVCIIKRIQEHIAESDFTVDDLARETGLSRIQLYRKIKDMTNLSAGDLIRSIKLEHAAHLIIQERFSILQIALEVGFSNPSHFSRCFKRKYGRLPSQFI